MHHEVEVLVMAMLWMVGLCCSIDKYVLDLLVCVRSMLEPLSICSLVTFVLEHVMALCDLCKQNCH